LNLVKLADAEGARLRTDKGLASCDGLNWAAHRPLSQNGKPKMTVRDAEGRITSIPVSTAPARNYVLGIDFEGGQIRVATAEGLIDGIREKQ